MAKTLDSVGSPHTVRSVQSHFMEAGGSKLENDSTRSEM